MVRAPTSTSSEGPPFWTNCVVTRASRRWPRKLSRRESSQEPADHLPMKSRRNSFFAELKRRNVYKLAVAYAVISWLLIQVATQVFLFFEVRTPAVRRSPSFCYLPGFPVALILSWAFEITPEGIKRAEDVEPNKSITRKTGRKLVGITMALAVVAAGLFTFQVLRPRLMRESAATSIQLPATFSLLYLTNRSPSCRLKT